MTVTMSKDHTPVGVADLYDAKAVLGETSTVQKSH